MDGSLRRGTGVVPTALLLVVMGCESSVTDPGPPRDLSLLEEPLAELYREDAARLAARDLEARALGPLAPVEIPDEATARYYDALAAVWALDHPARDSVVDLWRVHTFPEPELHEILVGVAEGSRLAEAWGGGSTTTGVPEADALIERYGLELARFHEWSIGPWAVLRAGEPLNARALAARFRGVPGVRAAEPNGVFGDGHDIRSREEGGSLFLDYSVGFGDCPAGCIHRHWWTFRVEAGAAAFVRSGGSALPEPPEPLQP